MRNLKEETFYLASYFDSRMRGLDDNYQTSDATEAEDWAWEHLNQGGYVEIKNQKTGKEVYLDPDDLLDDYADYASGAFEDAINDSGVLEEDMGREIKRYSDVYSDERRNQGWWYFTTHGVQPGSVPKGVNILEVRDTPNGTYFRADAILNTSELEYYDIKERVPKQEESLNKKPANTKINIRESLNKYDLRTDNKYDLRNLYDACIMTDKEKRIIAEMISKNTRANVLYEALMNKFEGKELEESEFLDTKKVAKGEKAKSAFHDDPTDGMTKSDYIDWLMAEKGMNKQQAQRQADMFYESLKEGAKKRKGLRTIVPQNTYEYKGFIIGATDNGYSIKDAGSKYKEIGKAKNIDSACNFVDDFIGGKKNESLKESLDPNLLKNLLVNFFNSNFDGYGDPDNKVLSVDDIDVDQRNRVIEIHTMTFEDSSSNFYKDYENYQEVDMDDLSAFLMSDADEEEHDESLKESRTLKEEYSRTIRFNDDRIDISAVRAGNTYCIEVGSKYGEEDNIEELMDMLDDAKRRGELSVSFSEDGYENPNDAEKAVDSCAKYLEGALKESLKEDYDDDETYNRMRERIMPMVDALHEFEGDMRDFRMTYSFGVDDNGNITGGVDFDRARDSELSEEEIKSRFEEIFDENGFELDRRFKTNPGKTLFGRTHYQIIERDTK